MLPTTKIDSPNCVDFTRLKVTGQPEADAEATLDEEVAVDAYCQVSHSVIGLPHVVGIDKARLDPLSKVFVLLIAEIYLYWRFVPAGIPNETYQSGLLAEYWLALRATALLGFQLPS